ncbi:MAG: hypothetical protein WC520_02235, partial [Candidatus Paceibacterota bacterium]
MSKGKELYNKAILLRKEGLSYNEIRDIVPAGHGTIWRWCSHIKLTKKQVERLRDKKRNTSLIKNVMEKAQKDKRDSLVWAEEKLKDSKINSNLLISGAMLYWAEGYNSNSNLSAIFTNTDADMVKIMMRFFREIILVKDSKVKIMVRIAENGNVKEAEKYWSEVTNLSLERFQKPEILKVSL